MLAEHLARVYDDAQNATLIQNRRQTIRRAPRCAFTSVTANASLRPCQRLNQHSRRDPGTSRWPLGIGVWAPRTTRRRMTSPHGAARPRHGSRATGRQSSPARRLFAFYRLTCYPRAGRPRGPWEAALLVARARPHTGRLLFFLLVLKYNVPLISPVQPA